MPPAASVEVNAPALTMGFPDVSMVIAPGGRMDGATTSTRNNFREPLRLLMLGDTASDVSTYTVCIPLASQAALVPPGESCSVCPSQQTRVSRGAVVPVWSTK